MKTKQTIEQRFKAFLRTQYGEHVYKEFVKKAKQSVNSHNKIGARTIIENIRWDSRDDKRAGKNKYKINDNYISRFARKAMKENKDLRGLFALRKLKS